MPSDEPSNRQSVNTGLRLNRTPPAPTLGGCGKHSHELPIDTNLSDEQNYFDARFKASNTESCVRAPAVPDDCDHALRSRCETFREVNIHKAAGSDGLPGCVLRACTDQLASVFTDIFNLSLTETVIPTFQADHHNPCAQEHCLNGY
jgi:hypothetical protein